MNGEPIPMKSAITLTVASYNICHGHYAAFDWEYLASPIRSVKPDLVGIQEVDLFTRRVGGIDSLRALSDAAGMPHALFVPTMDYDGGRYGTAILSRFPIEASEIAPLPAKGLEPRAIGCVRVSPAAGRELWFVNTHLSYKSAAVRHEQLSVLNERLQTLIPPEVPTVITGDFNTEEPLAPLVGERYGDINEARRYLTFHDPAIAIDRIVYTRASMVPLAHGMVRSDASDHDLLWGSFSVDL